MDTLIGISAKKGNGGIVWVNPDHLVSIVEDESRVHIRDGYSIETTEEEVKALIEMTPNVIRLSKKE